MDEIPFADLPVEDQLRELEREMALDFGWDQYIGPYSALPTPTSIRLLEIAPGLPIRCSFKIVDLNDLPVYSALSYTWGNPRGILPAGEDVEADRIAMSAKYPILCDEEVMWVQANCYYFMLQFQQIQKDVLVRMPITVQMKIEKRDIHYIWIDATCINQNSTFERTCQVRIMSRVYKQAKKVLIWLGREDALTRAGFDTMAQLQKTWTEIQFTRTSKQTLSKMIGTPGKSPLFKKLGMPDITLHQWQGVLSLYRRTWFARSWTVQEYALARDVLFVCGTLFSNKSLWADAACFLTESDWADSLLVLGRPRDETMRKSRILETLGLAESSLANATPTVLYNFTESIPAPITNLEDARAIQSLVSLQRWGSSKNTFPLQRILAVFAETKVTLPMDRIYAFLGLVPESSWYGLHVDYTRPVTDTYLQSTWAVIKSTRRLSILSHVEDRSLRTDHQLPSWVPDYGAYRTKKPLDPGCELSFAGYPPGFYDCTRSSLYELNIDDTLSRTLSVSGLFQGKIEGLGKAHSVGNEHYFLEQSRPILEFDQTLPSDYLWRTLLSDEDIWAVECPATAHSARHIFHHWTKVLYVHMNMTKELIAKGAAPDDIDVKQRRLRKAFVSFVVLSRDLRFPEVTLSSEQNIPYKGIHQYIHRIHAELKQQFSSRNSFADTRRVDLSLSAHMCYRRLFTTSKKCIGKGPASTQTGDEVWILRGAKVPYVLRPLGEGQYELVGEAYVHTIMRGEAMDEKSKFNVITLV
jgi:hypothetical protein